MATETKKEIGLEIGHVLFIDIVGYSKLLIDEQRDYLHTLSEVVRRTDSFRAADAAGKLTHLPSDSGLVGLKCMDGDIRSLWPKSTEGWSVGLALALGRNALPTTLLVRFPFM
jgi:hypothetical protein